MGGKYQGTQLDGLSARDTIRVNGYIPCLTELYRAYRCSLSTFHHGRSINLAATNAETVKIGFCPRLRVSHGWVSHGQVSHGRVSHERACHGRAPYGRASHM